MARKSGKNKGYCVEPTESGKMRCREYVDLPDGTRKQLCATGETEREARENFKRKCAKIWKEGKQIKSQGYTVKTWCEYWLQNVKTNLKGNTKDSYYFSFKNHIFPILGKTKIKNLTLNDIQKAVNKVKNKKVLNNGVLEPITGKTVKEAFAPLKQALRYAMATDKMSHISLELLDMPPVKKGTRNIRNETEQQIVTDYFCNRIPDKPFNLYYAPIAIMDARGLRPEEVRWTFMGRYKF